MQTRLADIAIIGAGPAGSVAATLLRRRGHSVCVFERAHFPRFVIGESLLPSAMIHLEEAGLLPRLAAKGYLEKAGVAIMRGDDRAEFDFAEQFHDGYRYAWQVKRAEFDQALVDGAEEQGVEFTFGAEVIDVVCGETPSLTWRTDDGRTHTSEFLFVIDASGYGRVLPRLFGLQTESGLPSRKSVFTHVAGDRRPEGRRGTFSWAVCHDQCWVWVIPFADGTTSVGMVALPEAYEQLPDDPADALRTMLDSDTNLKTRFDGCEFLFPPRTISAYSAKSTAVHGPGYCLVGNSAEFIDPIFSSGITVALMSSRLAADVLHRQLGGESVNWESDYAEPLDAGLDVFRDYVDYWYDGSLEKLFYSDASPRVRRQMCSVLAGYVWDTGNPFVEQRRRKIPQLIRILAEGASS